MRGKPIRAIRRLLRAEDGATAIEYGLIAALIGLVVVSALSALGTSVKTIFEQVAAGF